MVGVHRLEPIRVWSASSTGWPSKSTFFDLKPDLQKMASGGCATGGSCPLEAAPQEEVDLHNQYFLIWSQIHRKWPLEAMPQEKFVQIRPFGWWFGSIDKNQSESDLPHLQGDLLNQHFWIWSQIHRKWPLEVMSQEELVQINRPFGWWLRSID